MNTQYGYETIGPLMARMRKVRGYSQVTVAQMLCTLSGHVTVTRNEVSRWERQERIPSEYWLKYLADVLSVPVDRLRGACVAARGLETPVSVDNHEPDIGGPLVTTWLTIHHGPGEFVIALGGVEVDQIRTVLAPINPAPPDHQPNPVSEIM